MAKGRMLQNRISKSRKLSELSSDTVRLLYTWLLSHLDVNGCFYADPLIVKNLVFTRLNHSAEKIKSCLDELENKGLINRYESDGEIYLQYPDFEEKQPKIHKDREGKPDIPPPTHDQLVSNSRATQTQEKLKEVKLKEKKENNARARDSHTPKIKYLDSVFLTPEEYEKLKEAIGQKSLEAGIEKLNYSILSNGKKYKDHYLTLLNWHNRGFIDEYMQGHKKYAGGARSEEPVYTRKPMTPDEAWAEEEKKLKEKEG